LSSADVSPATLETMPLSMPCFITEVTNPFPGFPPKDGTSPPNPFSVRIEKIHHGVIIDHIGMGVGSDTQLLWKQLGHIRKVLNVWSQGTQGVLPKGEGSGGGIKGIIALPEFPLDYFSPEMLKKLAAIAPGCTLCVIDEGVVIQKFQLAMPPRIHNIQKDLSCRNHNCVSHRSNHQNVLVHFDHARDLIFECHYCAKEHLYSEIWEGLL